MRLSLVPPPPNGEGAGVLQEEIALLGKEDVEARQVHLLLIDFDLREIGAVRGVQGQRGAMLYLASNPPS